jgi:hypothetical protein
MSRPHGKSAGLPIINGKAAAIDIGSRFHVAAVSPELCDEPVQTFQAFTGDLQRLADWLVSLGIETVAMESTGVYWIPVTRFSRSGIGGVATRASLGQFPDARAT